MFDNWISNQNINKWRIKWKEKSRHAKEYGRLNKLTFNEYLFKAFEANLTSHEQVSHTGYHLARINDEGDYTVDGCRFITAQENYAEKDTSYLSGVFGANIGHVFSQGEKHANAKLTNKQVEEIWFSTWTFQELSEYYNVTILTIVRIKNKSRWSSVTNKLSSKQAQVILLT